MKRHRAGYVLALVLGVTLVLVSSVSLLALRLGAGLRAEGGQLARLRRDAATGAVAERFYWHLHAQEGRVLPEEASLLTWLEAFAEEFSGEVEPPLSCAVRCTGLEPDSVDAEVLVELREPGQPPESLHTVIRVEVEPIEPEPVPEAAEAPEETGEAQPEPDSGGAVLVRVSWVSYQPG